MCDSSARDTEMQENLVATVPSDLEEHPEVEIAVENIINMFLDQDLHENVVTKDESTELFNSKEHAKASTHIAGVGNACEEAKNSDTPQSPDDSIIKSVLDSKENLIEVEEAVCQLVSVRLEDPSTFESINNLASELSKPNDPNEREPVTSERQDFVPQPPTETDGLNDCSKDTMSHEHGNAQLNKEQSEFVQTKDKVQKISTNEDLNWNKCQDTEHQSQKVKDPKITEKEIADISCVDISEFKEDTGIYDHAGKSSVAEPVIVVHSGIIEFDETEIAIKNLVTEPKTLDMSVRVENFNEHRESTDMVHNLDLNKCDDKETVALDLSISEPLDPECSEENFVEETVAVILNSKPSNECNTENHTHIHHQLTFSPQITTSDERKILDTNEPRTHRSNDGTGCDAEAQEKPNIASSGDLKEYHEEKAVMENIMNRLSDQETCEFNKKHVTTEDQSTKPFGNALNECLEQSNRLQDHDVEQIWDGVQSCEYSVEEINPDEIDHKEARCSVEPSNRHLKEGYDKVATAEKQNFAISLNSIDNNKLQSDFPSLKKDEADVKYEVQATEASDTYEMDREILTASPKSTSNSASASFLPQSEAVPVNISDNHEIIDNLERSVLLEIELHEMKCNSKEDTCTEENVPAEMSSSESLGSHQKELVHGKVEKQGLVASLFSERESQQVSKNCSDLELQSKDESGDDNSCMNVVEETLYSILKQNEEQNIKTNNDSAQQCPSCRDGIVKRHLFEHRDDTKATDDFSEQVGIETFDKDIPDKSEAKMTEMLPPISLETCDIQIALGHTDVEDCVYGIVEHVHSCTERTTLTPHNLTSSSAEVDNLEMESGKLKQNSPSSSFSEPYEAKPNDLIKPEVSYINYDHPEIKRKKFKFKFEDDALDRTEISPRNGKCPDLKSDAREVEAVYEPLKEETVMKEENIEIVPNVSECKLNFDKSNDHTEHFQDVIPNLEANAIKQKIELMQACRDQEMSISSTTHEATIENRCLVTCKDLRQCSSFDSDCATSEGRIEDEKIMETELQKCGTPLPEKMNKLIPDKNDAYFKPFGRREEETVRESVYCVQFEKSWCLGLPPEVERKNKKADIMTISRWDSQTRTCGLKETRDFVRLSAKETSKQR